MGKMNQMEYKQKEVYKLIEDHYRKNFDRLVKVLGFRAGGRHNAEDIVQEAYTRALTYWNAFDMKEEFGSWFKSIQTNAMKDFYQEEIKRGIVSDTMEGLGTQPVALKQLEADELVKKINDTKPNVKKILTLHFIQGYRPKEISEMVPEKHRGVEEAIRRFRKEQRV